jgi:ribosomal-protein-alanine N-acetyltransferase
MIRLRAMLQTDISAVHAIEQVVSDDPWTLKIFSDCLLVGYKCFVFEEIVNDKKDIIGYGLLSIDKREAHILNVSIRADKRRQGLGIRMMHNLLRVARKYFIKKVNLEVKMSNKPALDLYKKLNFKQSGVKIGYYPLPDGSHEDALVFALQLKKIK